MTESFGLLLVSIINILANHALLTRKRSIRYCLIAFVLNTVFISCAWVFLTGYIKNPIILESALTFISFLYIAYIYLVFSESIVKKIFTMFSVWIFSLISFFIALRSVLFFSGAMDVEYTREFVWILRLSIQILLYSAMNFWFGKLYRKVISIVTDKTMNFMLLYPVSAFLLLKSTGLVSLEDSGSVFVVILFILFIILGYLITFVGIAASSEVELQRYMANYDSLTGIANRANIMNQLAKTIETSNRSKRKFALFVCDLDDFKQINDEYGHIIGDKALKYAAQAVRRVLRNTDSVGRFGGDEFLIIQQFVRDRGDVETLIDRIFEELKTPFIIMDKEIHIRLSIGVSIYPDDTSDFETLINQADSAMYEAKKREGCTLRFFEPQTSEFEGLTEFTSHLDTV